MPSEHGLVRSGAPRFRDARIPATFAPQNATEARDGEEGGKAEKRQELQEEEREDREQARRTQEREVQGRQTQGRQENREEDRKAQSPGTEAGRRSVPARAGSAR